MGNRLKQFALREDLHTMSHLSHPPFVALAFTFLLFHTIAITDASFPQGKTPSLPLPTRVIYQFSNLTWVENLAVRSNGELLVTLNTSPDLYLISTIQRTATLVHSFPAVTGLLGITEVEHDMFYVVAGNFTGPTRPKSFSIWEVDMRSFSLSGARVRKVTDTPEAVALNGLVTLSKADHTILMADSFLGVAWKLNVKTGVYFIAISEPAMAPVATAKVPIGINGVKIRDDYLYFTNTNQGLIARVPISDSGNATGGVEVLATGIFPDDFDLDCDGRPWIGQNTVNVVSVLLQNGTVINVAGAKDQLTVAGPTSCLFGRSREPNGSSYDEDTSDLLYCTTTGGLAAPVNGTVVEPGKIVVIDTKAFWL